MGQGYPQKYFNTPNIFNNIFLKKGLAHKTIHDELQA